MKTSLFHAAGLAAVALAAALLCGCQASHVAQPLTAKLSGNDPDTQLEFWHALAERHVASNDEAFHGLLLYVDGKDDSADYAARVATLKSRKMLPANFNSPAGNGVQRGVLAVAIVQALHLKGGWVMHVFGNRPRYALRELEFEGVYPPSSDFQTFSGTEFVGIIGKMEDYQSEGSAPAAPSPELAPASQPAPGLTP
ncbi:MAG: hypothetical protein JWL69_4166 [Phycisphaerales bacterium]|nr:hypothetical protein [Phycisphaerales bacterium]MDB5357653.1 hypothetical protein [Phycisphaerales bacterium]